MASVLPSGLEGDGRDVHAVAEPEVAEDSADVFGELARQVRQLPASLAIELAGLQETPGGESGVGLLRHIVGPFHQSGQEMLADRLGRGSFRLVNGLQLPNVRRVGQFAGLSGRRGMGGEEDPEDETDTSPVHAGASEGYSVWIILENTRKRRRFATDS